MFDSKKKIIIPDVLRDIQHRSGRINLSEGVLANFVFNRTTANSIVNRSNKKVLGEKINDVIFFDDSFKDISFKLQGMGPFVKNPALGAPYFQVFQPEQFSSSLVKRFNSKSLVFSENKRSVGSFVMDDAAIQLIDSELSGSFISLTSADGTAIKYRPVSSTNSEKKSSINWLFAKNSIGELTEIVDEGNRVYSYFSLTDNEDLNQSIVIDGSITYMDHPATNDLYVSGDTVYVMNNTGSYDLNREMTAYIGASDANAKSANSELVTNTSYKILDPGNTNWNNFSNLSSPFEKFKSGAVITTSADISSATGTGTANLLNNERINYNKYKSLVAHYRLKSTPENLGPHNSAILPVHVSSPTFDDDDIIGNAGTRKIGSSNYSTGRTQIGNASDWYNIIGGGSNKKKVSFSAWVYWEGRSSSTFPAIIDFGGDAGIYVFAPNPSTPETGQVSFGTKWSGGGISNSGFQSWRSSTAISLNTWNHIVVTYDANSQNNNPYFYINGVESASSMLYAQHTGTFIGFENNSDKVEVGNVAGSVRDFNGKIAELAIWDDCLTLEDSKAIYYSTLGKSGLVGRTVNDILTTVDGFISNSKLLLSSSITKNDANEAIIQLSHDSGRQATAKLTVSPGNGRSFSANATSEGDWISITDQSGRNIFYVITNAAETGAVSTGTLIDIGTDIGSRAVAANVNANSLVNNRWYRIVSIGGTTNWGRLGASSNSPKVGEVFQAKSDANGIATGSSHGIAEEAIAGGVAISLNLTNNSGSYHWNLLEQLKLAINSEKGHNSGVADSNIEISALPIMSAGSQSITLKQKSIGSFGNSIIRTSLRHLDRTSPAGVLKISGFSGGYNQVFPELSSTLSGSLDIPFPLIELGFKQDDITVRVNDKKLDNNFAISFEQASAVATVRGATGNAAHGLLAGQKITLTSTDGTKVDYFVSDTADGGVAHLNEVTDNDVLKSTGNIRATLSDGATKAISVGFDLSGATSQRGFLVLLKAAIENSLGHDSKITVTAVPAATGDPITITLTQAETGDNGNTTTSENLATISMQADFAGGRGGYVVDRTGMFPLGAEYSNSPEDTYLNTISANDYIVYSDSSAEDKVISKLFSTGILSTSFWLYKSTNSMSIMNIAGRVRLHHGTDGSLAITVFDSANSWVEYRTSPLVDSWTSLSMVTVTVDFRQSENIPVVNGGTVFVEKYSNSEPSSSSTSSTNRDPVVMTSQNNDNIVIFGSQNNAGTAFYSTTEYSMTLAEVKFYNQPLDYRAYKRLRKVSRRPSILASQFFPAAFMSGSLNSVALSKSANSSKTVSINPGTERLISLISTGDTLTISGSSQVNFNFDNTSDYPSRVSEGNYKIGSANLVNYPNNISHRFDLRLFEALKLAYDNYDSDILPNLAASGVSLRRVSTPEIELEFVSSNISDYHANDFDVVTEGYTRSFRADSSANVGSPNDNNPSAGKSTFGIANASTNLGIAIAFSDAFNASSFSGAGILDSTAICEAKYASTEIGVLKANEALSGTGIAAGQKLTLISQGFTATGVNSAKTRNYVIVDRPNSVDDSDASPTHRLVSGDQLAQGDTLGSGLVLGEGDSRIGGIAVSLDIQNDISFDLLSALTSSISSPAGHYGDILYSEIGQRDSSDTGLLSLYLYQEKPGEAGNTVVTGSIYGASWFDFSGGTNDAKVTIRRDNKKGPETFLAVTGSLVSDEILASPVVSVGGFLGADSNANDTAVGGTMVEKDYVSIFSRTPEFNLPTNTPPENGVPFSNYNNGNNIDPNDNLISGDNSIANDIAVRYDENSYQTFFENIKHAISSSYAHRDKITATVLGPSGFKSYDGDVIKDNKVSLNLTQKTGGSSGNTKIEFSSSVGDYSQTVTKFSINNFSFGFDRVAARTDSYDGLRATGQRTYMLRFKTLKAKVSDGVIFSVASSEKARIYMYTSNNSRDLTVKVYSTQAADGNHWVATIPRPNGSNLQSSYDNDEWLTAFVSINGAANTALHTDTSKNYFAIYESSSHGGRLKRVSFTQVGSAENNVRVNLTADGSTAVSDSQQPHLYFGYGNPSDGIATNAFVSGQSANKSYFFDGFEVAELSIFDSCLEDVKAGYIAESHLVERSKSGFRSKPPKLALKDTERDTRRSNFNSNRIFKDDASNVQILEPFDVIYPNMLPAGTTGSFSIKIGDPTLDNFNGKSFAIMFPDSSVASFTFDKLVSNELGVAGDGYTLVSDPTDISDTVDGAIGSAEISNSFKIGLNGLTTTTQIASAISETINNANRYSDVPAISSLSEAVVGSLIVQFTKPGQSSSTFKSTDPIVASVYTCDNVANADHLRFGYESSGTFFSSENDGSIKTLKDISGVDRDFSDLGRTSHEDHIIAGRKSTKISAKISCDFSKLLDAINSGNIDADFIRDFNSVISDPEKRLFVAPYNVQTKSREFKDGTEPLNPVIKFKIGTFQYSARLDSARRKDQSNHYNIGTSDVSNSNELAQSIANSINYAIDVEGLKADRVTPAGSVVEISSSDIGSYMGRVNITGYSTGGESSSLLFSTSGFASELNPIIVRESREKISKVDDSKIKPFVDIGTSNDDPFFREGTSELNFTEFGAASRDKVRIEIDINPVTRTTLGFTTGSVLHDGFADGSFNPIGYFNFSSKRWESITKPGFNGLIQTLQATPNQQDPTHGDYVSRAIETMKAVRDFHQSAPVAFGGTYGFSIHRFDVAQKAQATITIADGDAPPAAVAGQKITITSADGAEINYVVVGDGAAAPNPSIATGEQVFANTVINNANLTAGVEGVAIRTQNNQNDFLVQLKAAINSAFGHNREVPDSKIEISEIPARVDGSQTIILTQAVKGSVGEKPVTSDVSGVTVTNFSGGYQKVKDKNYSFSAGDRHYVELPLRGRPISNFGFPFADTFKPSEGQKLDLSKHLDGPFLLEKFQIICSSSISDEVSEGLARVIPETPRELPYSHFGSGATDESNAKAGIFNSDYRSSKPQLLYDQMRRGSTVAKDSTEYNSNFTEEYFEKRGAYHMAQPEVFADASFHTDKLTPVTGDAITTDASGWWRCDTFFLLRERPSVNTVFEITGSIGAQSFRGTDNTDNASSKIKIEFINPNINDWGSGASYHRISNYLLSNNENPSYIWHESMEIKITNSKLSPPKSLTIRPTVKSSNHQEYLPSRLSVVDDGSSSNHKIVEYGLYDWNSPFYALSDLENIINFHGTFCKANVLSRPYNSNYLEISFKDQNDLIVTSASQNDVNVQIVVRNHTELEHVDRATTFYGTKADAAATAIVKDSVSYDVQASAIEPIAKSIINLNPQSSSSPYEIVSSNKFTGATNNLSTSFEGISIEEVPLSKVQHPITQSTRELISYAQVAYYGYAAQNHFTQGGNDYKHFYFTNEPGQLYFNDNSSTRSSKEHLHVQLFGSFESTGSNERTLLENGLGRDLNVKVGNDASPYSFVSGLALNAAVPAQAISTHRLSSLKKLTDKGASTAILQPDNENVRHYRYNVLGDTSVSNFNTSADLKHLVLNNRSDAQAAFASKYSSAGFTFNLHDGILDIKSKCKTTPSLFNFFPYRLAVIDRYAQKYNFSSTTKTRLPDFVNVTVSGSFSGGTDYDGLGNTRNFRSLLGDSPNSESIKISTSPFSFDHFKDKDPKLDNMLTSLDKTVNLGTKFEVASPYILKPEDKITLGFQTAVPGFHSGFTSFLNIGGGTTPTELLDNSTLQNINQEATSADIDSGKCVEATFHPFAGSKLVLYGTYVKDGVPKRPKSSTNMSNVLFEVIGEEIFDQYETELDSEFSGSMASEVFSEPSFERVGLATDNQVGVNFSERTNSLVGFGNPQPIVTLTYSAAPTAGQLIVICGEVSTVFTTVQSGVGAGSANGAAEAVVNSISSDSYLSPKVTVTRLNNVVTIKSKSTDQNLHVITGSVPYDNFSKNSQLLQNSFLEATGSVDRFMSIHQGDVSGTEGESINHDMVFFDSLSLDLGRYFESSQPGFNQIEQASSVEAPDKDSYALGTSIYHKVGEENRNDNSFVLSLSSFQTTGSGLADTDRYIGNADVASRNFNLDFKKRFLFENVNKFSSLPGQQPEFHHAVDIQDIRNIKREGNLGIVPSSYLAGVDDNSQMIVTQPALGGNFGKAYAPDKGSGTFTETFETKWSRSELNKIVQNHNATFAHGAGAVTHKFDANGAARIHGSEYYIVSASNPSRKLRMSSYTPTANAGSKAIFNVTGQPVAGSTITLVDNESSPNSVTYEFQQQPADNSLIFPDEGASGKVANQTHLVKGDDDPDFKFTKHPDVSVLQFTNNNTNSRITVDDADNLSLVTSENTTIAHFDADANAYLEAADHADYSMVEDIELSALRFTNDTNSHVNGNGDHPDLSFGANYISSLGWSTSQASNANNALTVSDHDDFSFVQEEDTTVMLFANNSTRLEAPDQSYLTLVETPTVNAMVFDGTSSRHIQIASAAASTDFLVRNGAGNADTAFTISVWLKPDNLNGWHGIAGNWTGPFYFQQGDNRFRFTLYDNTASAHNHFYSPTVSGAGILDGSTSDWVQITLVYTPESSSGANNEQVQFYKNGVAWGSPVVSPNSSYVVSRSTSNKFTIGTYGSSASFDGKMSNFLFFKHDGQSGRSSSPSTAAEVAALYNDGFVAEDYTQYAKGDDLVGYYKLDENPATASQITDYSGQNNHMTAIDDNLGTDTSNHGLQMKRDTNFTISFWMKKSETTGSRTILSKGYYDEYVVRQEGRGLRLYVRDLTGSHGQATNYVISYYQASNILSNDTGVWEHITVAYNKETMQATFYKNGGTLAGGTQQTSARTPWLNSYRGYGEMQDTNSVLAIGAIADNRPNGTDYKPFVGRLANLAIWKHTGTAMTADYVKGLYNGGFFLDYKTSHISNNELVAYYKLNGTADSSGNNNDAQAVGGSLTTATDSDLKNKYDNSFTISFWVFLQYEPDSMATVVSKDGEWRVYIVGTRVDVQLADNTYHGSGTGYRTFTKSGLSVQSWTHITIRYDRSGTCTIDFNAVDRSSSSVASVYSNETQNTTSNLYIGTSNGSADRFTGYLSNILIFNHDDQNGRGTALLTDTEVGYLYHGGRVCYDFNNHPKAADLVGYWKLNETVSSNFQITDYSGNSRHAYASANPTIHVSPPNSGARNNLLGADHAFTISMWLKLDSGSSGSEKYILSKNNGASEYLLWYKESTGDLNLRLNDRRGSTNNFSNFLAPTSSSNQILDGHFANWVHIALVYTPETYYGANNESVQFYKNGSAWGSAVAGDNAAYAFMRYNNSNRTYIGTDHGNTPSANRAEGSISNVLFFKHDGTSGRSQNKFVANDIASLYNGGKVVKDFSRHSRKADLVAYYKLDETAGDNVTIADSSGRNNNLRSGGSTAVTTDSSSGLHMRSDISFTISFWLKKTTGGISGRYILTKTGNFVSSAEYVLQHNDRQLRLRLCDSTAMDTGSYGEAVYQTSATFLSSTYDTWEHVTISYDRNSTDVKFYLNGQLGETVTLAIADSDGDYSEMQDTANVLRIGSFAGGAANKFQGRLSHMAIWKHDGQSSRLTTNFTDDEVLGLYNAGSPFDYSALHYRSTDLVGYWKLNDASATVGGAPKNLANQGGMNFVSDSHLKTRTPSNATFAFWIKLGDLSGNRTVFYKGSGSATVGTEYWCYINGGSTLYFRVVDQNPPDGGVPGTLVYNISNALASNTNNWQHIVLRLDSVNRRVYVHRDGGALNSGNHYAAQSEPNYNFGESDNTTNPFRIGYDYANSQGFAGQMSNLLFFNHGTDAIMDQSDAAALYTAGSPPKVNVDYNTHNRGTDLVGYWKLDETASNEAVISDSSGEGNHGVLPVNNAVTSVAASGLQSANASDVGFTFAFFVLLDNTNEVNTPSRVLFALDSAYECTYSPKASSAGDEGRITLVLHNNANSQVNSFTAPLVGGKRILQDSIGLFAHIAITYTPETSLGANDEQVQFYKNGVAWGSPVVSPNGNYVFMKTVATSKRFTIGNQTTSSGKEFIGRLSNFLVFKHDGESSRSSTVLNATEVSALYNSGAEFDYNTHSKSADLVGYWKMNEDTSGQPAIAGGPGPDGIRDYSGENNHINFGTNISRGSSSGLTLPSGNTAVTMQGSAHATYGQLLTAIGAGSQAATINAVNQVSANGTFTLTQATAGASGNKVITTANGFSGAFVPPRFTGGTGASPKKVLLIGYGTDDNDAEKLLDFEGKVSQFVFDQTSYSSNGESSTDSERFLLRFSTPNKYFGMHSFVHGVNQVNDTKFRRNSALLFGFGNHPTRLLESSPSNTYAIDDANKTINETYKIPSFSSEDALFDTNGTNWTGSKVVYVTNAISRMITEHPKGVKYGMMNYDHVRPSVKFRRNRFGQFRDMLEGRKFGAMANISEPFRMAGGLESGAANRQSTAVEVKFFNKEGNLLQNVNPNVKLSWDEGEPPLMFSQNLDKFQRSAVPFFDLPSALEIDLNNAEEAARLGGRVRLEQDILGQELIAL